MTTPLTALNIQVAYWIHQPCKSCYACEKFLDFLLAILANIYLNLVIMETPLAPLEI